MSSKKSIIYSPVDVYPRSWYDEDFRFSVDTIFYLNKSLIIDDHVKEVIFCVRLYPGDHRGYHTIVTVQVPEEPRLLFNRSFSFYQETSIALNVFILASLWINFMESKNVICQMEMSSYQIQSATAGNIIIGMNEPYVYHLHIVCLQAHDFKLDDKYDYLSLPLDKHSATNTRDKKITYPTDVAKELVGHLQTEFMKYMKFIP